MCRNRRGEDYSLNTEETESIAKGGVHAQIKLQPEEGGLEES